MQEILEKKRDNKILTSIVIIALILGSFFVGLKTGEGNNPKDPVGLKNENLDRPDDVDFSAFWEVWNLLNERYVDNGEVLTQDKVWGAIQGLSSSLGDPYTVFLPPKESERFEEDISGNFGGVGMEIDVRDNVLTVVAPLKDSPAEKAGIKTGDKIIAIDGKDISGQTIDESVGMIRGEIGTTVKLTIIREGTDSFNVEIRRDIIKIPTIETELRSGVFIIRLFNFSAISTNEFRKALREFIQSGSNKLILDLRGNPGGYLNAATDMASWFLPVGKVIVTEDYGNNGEDIVHRSKGYDVFNNSLEFIILVNGGSASASEILAGALKEHGKAIVVGTKTFGKGSVQELVPLKDNASLKVTTAKWLTPNGNSISENGISPDVEVEITLEEYEAGLDPQLDKAIELLLE